MAKLFFRYGAMNSGKSTALLQVAHNYEERDQRALIVKPATDTKGGESVISRLGVSRPVDVLLGVEEDLRENVRHACQQVSASGDDIACVLIDEAQFLTSDQVDQAFATAVLDNLPVIAFGIRTDFRTRAFPGSLRLLEIAHELEEMRTICRCGRKAILNARLDGGRLASDGPQVVIDSDNVVYEALCGSCYLQQSTD